MRSRRKFSRAALLVAACAVAACSSIPRELAQPRVTMESLALAEATVDHQRFVVMLRFDNPNPFDIPIEAVEFSARLSGQGVLIGESAESATLPARGTETLRVEVTTEIVSSFESMLAVVRGPEDAIPYELNGRITLASGFDRRVRISASGAVPLSQATGAVR